MSEPIIAVEKKKHPPVAFLVYGNSGIGKTLFSALAPNVRILDTEQSSKYIKGVSRRAIKSMADIDDEIAQIKAKKITPDTVVIDTLDELVDNFAKHEARARGMITKDGNLAIHAWGFMKERIFGQIRALKSLGVNVLFTCHAVNEEIPGEGKMWRMKLPGSYAKDIMGMMDAAGFLGWAKNAEGERIRRLHLRPTETFDAKSRGDLNILTGETTDILPVHIDQDLTIKRVTPNFAQVLEYYDKVEWTDEPF